MSLARDELGELSIERDVRWLSEMQERQFVEHIRQPLAFLLPVYVQSPDGVVERLRAHGHLRCQRLLAEVLEGTANLEVLGKVVFPVQSDHCLALLRIVGITLE